MENNLTVRTIEERDIPLIVDYWLKSDPDFLVSMGVDLDKLPSGRELTEMLKSQIDSPLKEKKSYALIWEEYNQPIGHCNVNQIVYGQQAHMHLHIWHKKLRQKGIGQKLVRLSLPFFFEDLELKVVYCEPYALNPAPNKTLKRVGFSFIKTYRTIPGSLNFEQEVNQWKLSEENYKKL